MRFELMEDLAMALTKAQIAEGGLSTLRPMAGLVKAARSIYLEALREVVLQESAAARSANTEPTPEHAESEPA